MNRPTDDHCDDWYLKNIENEEDRNFLRELEMRRITETESAPQGTTAVS